MESDRDRFRFAGWAEPRPGSVEEFEQGGRYCICADPENCTEAVPGRICKAGRSVPKVEWDENEDGPDYVG